MVYVDDMNIKYRGMIMSHMIADSSEELISMAQKIGVAPKWIQKQGTTQEHFDICLKMKERAIKSGAIEITWKELGKMCIARNSTGGRL